MAKVVGLDIGSGFTKCYDGKRRVVFPSVYGYRRPALWEEPAGVIEGVGEEALEIAQHPNAVVLYPIMGGKPQHEAFLKLAREALKRLRTRFLERIFLVSGLPYETGRMERERIKDLLKRKLKLSEIAVYPQSIGTLFDLDLRSATVVNIGHGTTEILVVEDLNPLGGVSEPLASGYVLTALSDMIQTKHGFKPSTENLLSLITGKTDKITAFGKREVHQRNIRSQIESSVSHLADKICYDVRYLLNQLPPNLECAENIVLSGGGSLIKGVKEAIRKGLEVEKLVTPSDPIFSNVHGFYKIGRKLYG